MIELHQFSHSHFAEKARWALDYKGLLHTRINYLPGPHVPQIQRLSGKTTVPVLVLDGVVIPGSAAILDALEERCPEPALYPADPDLRREALAIQHKLDEELGADIRRAGFERFLGDADFVCATFASEKPAWKRSLYRAFFPGIRVVMKRAMNITPEEAARSKQRVDVLLDFLAEKAAKTGYLAGDAFSVADLTGAALLAPAAGVDHGDMRQAQPLPPRFRDLCEEWGRHEAMQWCKRIYAAHRPPARGVLVA